MVKIISYRITVHFKTKNYEEFAGKVQIKVIQKKYFGWIKCVNFTGTNANSEVFWNIFYPQNALKLH